MTTEKTEIMTPKLATPAGFIGCDVRKACIVARPASALPIPCLAQHAAKLGLAEPIGRTAQRRDVDEAHAERHLLRAAHQQPGAGLDGLHVGRRLQQTIGGAGVQPRASARQAFDVQPARFKVNAIQIGDLQFPARRRAGWRPPTRLRCCRRNRGR